MVAHSLRPYRKGWVRAHVTAFPPHHCQLSPMPRPFKRARLGTVCDPLGGSIRPRHTGLRISLLAAGIVRGINVIKLHRRHAVYLNHSLA
jgi:hypothetical protein